MLKFRCLRDMSHKITANLFCQAGDTCEDPNMTPVTEAEPAAAQQTAGTEGLAEPMLDSLTPDRT